MKTRGLAIQTILALAIMNHWHLLVEHWDNGFHYTFSAYLGYKGYHRSFSIEDSNLRLYDRIMADSAEQFKKDLQEGVGIEISNIK